MQARHEIQNSKAPLCKKKLGVVQAFKENYSLKPKFTKNGLANLDRVPKQEWWGRASMNERLVNASSTSELFLQSTRLSTS